MDALALLERGLQPRQRPQFEGVPQAARLLQCQIDQLAVDFLTMRWGDAWPGTILQARRPLRVETFDP